MNEDEYKKFINYVDEYNISFGKSQFIIQLNKFGNVKIKEDLVKIYAGNKFIGQLNWKKIVKKIVLEAENDQDKQFLVAKYLIFG